METECRGFSDAVVLFGILMSESLSSTMPGNHSPLDCYSSFFSLHILFWVGAGLNALIVPCASPALQYIMN